MKIPIVLVCAFAGCAFGSGPSTSGGTSSGLTAPDAAEIRTLSERIPAGGTVQVKFLLTQPRPIASSGTTFADYGSLLDGVSIMSTAGDAAGTAVAQNGAVYIAVASPNGDFGANLDYPFLTVTMDLPVGLPQGAVYPLSLNGTAQSVTGPITFTDSKPGTLTIGGSVSVRGVFPGGGTQPAGTVIHVRGSGFVPGTKLSARMKITNVKYVSSSEMQFTLQESTVMDSQQIQVTNPDGSQVVFYSYLRGTLVQAPSSALLRNTEPIFPTATRASATIGPLPASTPGQFTGFAVQNPTTGSVSLSFYSASTGATRTFVLQSGERLMNDLSSLLGTPVTSGDTISITATSGVQMFGLLGNENDGTVTPFVP